MMELIEPLAALPGVTVAMLIHPDGVPIATARPNKPTGIEDLGAPGKEDVLAALALGWSADLEHATSPLSWEQPKRIVLRCARGSIVMRRMRGATLLLVLSRSVAPEDVRLPMDGTVARIERSLRGSPGSSGDGADPPGPIPSRKAVRPDNGLAETNSNTSLRKGHSGN